MRRGAILAVLFSAALTAQTAGLWLDVPFVPQVKDGCGAAVLSMTMQYWRHHGASIERSIADPDAIYKRLYSAEAHGIFAGAMRQYLDDHGFEALIFAGRWTDLREHLAKGRPLIVGLRGGRESHYVVVAGVSEDAVEVNDPAGRKLQRMGRAEFQKKWRAAGNWTLLAVPRPGS